MRVDLPDRERTDCTLQLAWITHRQGNPQLAEEQFEAGVADWSNPFSLDRPFDPMSRPSYWASTGQLERALEVLEAGLERGIRHPWALRNPDLEALHGDPRFEQYAERLRAALDL